MTRCAWHECNAEFTPGDPRQRYCCPACQRARGAWTARRGGPLVDLLLADNVEGLQQAKARIEKEVNDALRKT